jgi:hypothetical protein
MLFMTWLRGEDDAPVAQKAGDAVAGV